VQASEAALALADEEMAKAGHLPLDTWHLLRRLRIGMPDEGANSPRQPARAVKKTARALGLAHPSGQISRMDDGRLDTAHK
jgi:hypothetical protein